MEKRQSPETLVWEDSGNEWMRAMNGVTKGGGLNELPS